MAARHIPYEVVGAGIPIAEAFYAEMDAALRAQFAVVKELGADAFRPHRNGSIKSLLFAEMPKGFRRIGSENGKTEAVPLMSTNIGKSAAQVIKAAPTAPNPERLPESFGWPGEWVIEDGRAMHATSSRVLLPTARYFLTIPRKPDDGFKPPETLREILQSAYEGAFHEHNMIASQRRLVAAEKDAA